VSFFGDYTLFSEFLLLDDLVLAAGFSATNLLALTVEACFLASTCFFYDSFACALASLFFDGASVTGGSIFT
jgi:hypothetical protein